jgi:two-component system LytT family response regulator
MQIKSLIIDDDPFIRDLLKDKLDHFIPEIHSVDTATNGKEGIQKINTLKPDLIFLDVEMGDMTGFEMLSQLEQISFETIFITSFSHYAIKAIRFNALDYLVKPIDLEELKRAVSRFIEKSKRQSDTGDNVRQLLKNLGTKKVSDQVLTFNTQEGEIRIKLENIMRIEGERNYSFIHLSNGKRKLVSKTLGDFEEILADKSFFRCHKSHLVNFDQIKKQQSRSSVLLADGQEVPIARRKQEEFKNWYVDLKNESDLAS